MTRALAATVRVALGILLGLLSFASAAAVPVPPLTSPVVDTTGTLAAEEIARLERQALALQRSSGAQLQILMLSSTAPQSIEDYAQRAFDAWKLGRQGVDDGLLVVVAKDDRKVRIQTGTGLESKVTDATAARLIQEYLVPKFRRGDYAGGLDDATLVIASLMNGRPLPPPMAAQDTGRLGGGAVVLLVIGVMAAILVPIGLLLWMLSSATTLVVRGTGPASGGPEATGSGSSGANSGSAAALGAVAGWLSSGRGHQPRSGGGWSGGGWSGGGGSSRGGGASGGW
ncbi:MAG: TPM domain-containing protein [Pseudomonadota bacterium]